MRCINIDWFECYCLEVNGARDAEYFRALGFFVKERDYGTPHMSEVFTIEDKYGDNFIEIRRAPKSKAGKHTIYPENACNIRLVNRYCYMDNAGEIMADFINQHGYEFRRIFRLDLAMDFVRFDKGEWPAKVMRAIVNYSYRKIYQANRRIVGTETWDKCVDNYISWGKKDSMVVTRFYNKSKELKDLGYKKPWIVQAWLEAGLITDPVRLVHVDEKGVETCPEVWRLEFQINSSARKYACLDTDQGKVWINHDLDTYLHRDRLLDPFQELAKHYFQFRIYRKNVRKYDCPQKILFDFQEDKETYRLTNTANDRIRTTAVNSCLLYIQKLRAQTLDGKCIKALDILENYFLELGTINYRYQGISAKVLQIMMAIRSKDIDLDDVKIIAKQIF